MSLWMSTQVRVDTTATFSFLNQIDHKHKFESHTNIADGRIVATINDQTEMETHIDDVDQLKYYAFASFEDRKRVEFFHNCNYTP